MKKTSLINNYAKILISIILSISLALIICETALRIKHKSLLTMILKCGNMQKN